LEGILLFFHIAVCFLLVIVVLLQSGKSADLAGAFGGYGSQSTFGPRGAATLLSKLTTTLAVLFMVTSLLLQIVAAGKNRSGSVLGKEKPAARTETSQPLKPASGAPQQLPPSGPAK
jgi:preprotein translocase subunit SecG